MKNLLWVIILLKVISLLGCVNETNKNEIVSNSIAEISNMNGEKITLKGQAVDAKSGAVLLLEGGELIFIDELDYWPEEFSGETVLVSGMLHTIKSPEAGKPGDKLIAQGAQGEQQTLRGASWKIDN